ncbi:OmpA family protein [Aquimarina sp. AD10]|uniref:OmpA family protein n=1 Tax=Aquimarina sp. AD10 TaxID=1714849 RepID=UPI000E54298B|nr:OmpA family protein [Aquimarina sp. AD10]AXT60400.1 OmpA family protein [Aquimarina sp. AD10]RKN01165.1 OmpA family protein [Aquimarina sp. AD10]
MAANVNKISVIGGTDSCYNITENSVTVKPDEEVTFGVVEWSDATAEEALNQQLYWFLRVVPTAIDSRRPGRTFGYTMKKKLCGPYSYVIEASTSDILRADSISDKIYVNGYTKPLIKKSEWRAEPEGSDIRKNPIKYGNKVYLWLDTEGLNGGTVSIEIYSRQLGYDQLIGGKQNIRVVNGEALYFIGNTNEWMAKVSSWRDQQEFYIQVKDGGGNLVFDEHDDDVHARYLRIDKEMARNVAEPSTNITPTKIYQPEVNAERFEPCKFEEIQITIPVVKDGKTTTDAIPVFKDGQILENPSTTTEDITRSVLFDFNDASINPAAEDIVNNVLGFLLDNRGTQITMKGYACAIGSIEINQELSQGRSDAVKDFFVQGGLEAGRIISLGLGELNAESPDDISRKNDPEYVNSRRVDISFSFAGHGANPVVFETIAPSSDKMITLDTIKLDTTDCYREDDKHENKIMIKSPDARKFEGSGASLQFPIQSTLSAANPGPIQYIWPKWNLIKVGTAERKMDSAAVYKVHIHSCRYYSDKNDAAILLKAYPDIKWNFQLSFNFSHAAAYTHANLPEYSRSNPMDSNVQTIRREMRQAQSRATASGIESRRMQNSPEMLSKFGLKLDAKWNEDKQNVEISTEFAEKLRTVINAMVKYKEMADKVKDTLGGRAKGMASRPPFMFEVKAPALNANIEWFLEQGKAPHQTKVATVGVLKFKAAPLIGASFTLDLLAIAGRMHPAIRAMIAGADVVLGLANGGMTFEAKFYGELTFDFQALKINSLSGIEGGVLDLGAKMGIEVTAEIHFAVTYEYRIMEVKLELRAEAKADAHFAAKVKVDADDKGLYAEPEVGFSGLIFTFKAEATVGGFKRYVEFGNKEEPFLKPEPLKTDKIYIL